MSTFTAAIQAAKKLRQHGKSLIREAIACSGVVSFHEYLYTALLSYRASQTIYEAFSLLSQNVPNFLPTCDLTEDKLHRFRVETEEARVSILSSIMFAAIPSHRGPNILAPTEFFNYWQEALEGLDKDKVRVSIQDMVVRWVCPEFLRDLTFGWLALQTEEFSDRLIRRLTSVSEILEKNLLKNALLGEPDYLTKSYKILVDLSHKTECFQDLQQFEEKTDTKYFVRRFGESLSQDSSQYEE
jgi:hypothetical protein